MNQGFLIHRGLVSGDAELVVERLLLLAKELVLEVAVLQAGLGDTADLVDVGGLLNEHCWLGKVLSSFRRPWLHPEQTGEKQGQDPSRGVEGNATHPPQRPILPFMIQPRPGLNQ